MALTLLACASASADVFWANQESGSIGRSSAGGRDVDQSFVRGAAAPRAVAVDGAHVYWAHGDEAGRIGRAGRSGRRVDQAFLKVGNSPGGVTLDTSGIYWTHTAFGFGFVGRALRDGSRPDAAFAETGPAPCGVAVDPDHVYWANGGEPGSIGRSHGRFDVEQDFVRRAADPCGVAVTHTHVYWANRAGNAIARSRLDGTRLQPRFIPALRPCGVAVDARHVYWSTGRDTIGRATLRGARVDQRFVRNAHGPCGVAVDPTVRAVPRAHQFGPARAGGPGAIKAFVLLDTSSSPLDVARIRILGSHRRDFVVTGDSCVPNVVPAGGACVFNVRFAPRATGARRARARVTSNASSSPTEIRLTGWGT